MSCRVVCPCSARPGGPQERAVKAVANAHRQLFKNALDTIAAQQAELARRLATETEATAAEGEQCRQCRKGVDCVFTSNQCEGVST